MPISKQRKSQMQQVAFKTFLKICRQNNLYCAVLQEMNRLVGNEEKYTTIGECIAVMNSDIFNKIFPILVDHIEHSYGQMRRNDSEYDYLVCCVNTCIHIIIEDGLHKDHSFFKNIQIPRFEELGGTIFNKAAKVIFGADFKDTEQLAPPIDNFRGLMNSLSSEEKNAIHQSLQEHPKFRDANEMINYISQFVTQMRETNRTEGYGEDDLFDWLMNE